MSDTLGSSAPSGPQPEPATGQAEAPEKKFKFPTAFTVLAAVLLLVWIASFFVPAGAYKKDASGSPTPGTYQKLPSRSAPAAPAPALDVDSPTESGQAPADAAAAPGAKTVREAGLPCVDTEFTFRFKQLWDSPPNGLYGVESSKGLWGPGKKGSSAGRRRSSSSCWRSGRSSL
jgi:hypothetical protein